MNSLVFYANEKQALGSPQIFSSVCDTRDFTQDAGALHCGVHSSVLGSFHKLRLSLQHGDEAGVRRELGLDRLVHSTAPNCLEILRR